MTRDPYDDFKDNPAMRDELATALQIPALQVALDLIRHRNDTVPLPYGASGIDAAAMATERQTRAVVISELAYLSVPRPEAPAQTPPETFGTEHSIDDFDNDPTKKTS